MPKPTQEDVIKFCHDNTFLDFIGVEIIPNENGGVHLELPIDEQHTNLYDIAHGGVLMTMADTAMGAECFLKNKKVVTASLTMEFMSPVMIDTRIITNAKILHDGRHILVCECEMKNFEGKIFAKAHATFFAIATV